MPDHYHLAIAWDWEYDVDFVGILERRVQARGLRSYSISHHNTHETARKLQRGDLSFGMYLDRASDTDENFASLARALRKTSATFVNAPDAVSRAIDKATMHLEFLSHGINVPFTIIISPFNKRREVELTLSDLAKLGRPFIIKPANTTGGGIGVILGAESLKDVIETRQHHKNDKYLLQRRVVPAAMNGRKGWFRVFFVFGRILPCWWDDETHVYALVTREDLEAFSLRPLVTITRKIAEICALRFFSTEIAAVEDGSFVVVDYVNDICDMRLQSKHKDGVPDLIVREICRRIAGQLKGGRDR